MMRKHAPPVVSLSTRPQEQDFLEQSQTHQSHHYLSALSHSTSPQDIGVQIYSSSFKNWSSFVRFYSLLKLYSRTDHYPYFTHSRGKQRRLIQVRACRLVFPGCVVTYLNFDSMSMREVIDDLNVVNSLVINREL